MDVLRREGEKSEELVIPELPKTASVSQVAVEPAGFYVHHAVVGAAIIAGGVLAGMVAPAIKPATRGAIIVSAVVLGSFLIWDDLTSHIEDKCPVETIWSFTPCPEKVAVTVVKKAEI